MQVNPELKKYIEEHIFPEYQKNEPYEKFLEDIRKLLKNKKKFIQTQKEYIKKAGPRLF